VVTVRRDNGTAEYDAARGCIMGGGVSTYLARIAVVLLVIFLILAFAGTDSVGVGHDVQFGCVYLVIAGRQLGLS
jgi:hypothetical protein